MKVRVAIASLLALCLCTAAPRAMADSRTEYLAELLKNSGNFRSRVQAVKTLGQIATTTTHVKEKSAILKALMAAAVDKNESVRLMVATALGNIGDAKALPTLKKLAKDKISEVKKQANASISKIEKKSAAGDDTAALLGLDDEGMEAEDLPDTFYVGIGAWGDKKAKDFADLEPKKYIKKTLKKKLGKMSAVVVQPDGEGAESIKKKAKKKGLTAYTLTGSVSKLKLDEKKNQASAKLQMVVLTSDGNMAMMLSATGAASVESSGNMNASRRKDLVYSAMLSAMNGLTEDLWNHFKKEIKTSKGKKKKKKKKKGGKKKGK
ncbi:MAG: HEAT repeat domain-containing protein [Deltaproteobacteria bacterium]|nr:HEAT repeat domain-containing protein [Deltaproteobacteria bacterium]